MDRWLPSIRATIRASTFIGYESHARRHVIPYIGDLRLTEISGEVLNDLYSRLAIDGKLGGTALAASTIHRCHVVLHRVFRDAIRWGYLERNPCDAADPPKRGLDKPEMTTWTAVELATFLAGTTSDPCYVVFHLLAMTGLRRGEALGLRWKDVDLERAVLSIRQTLIQIATGVRISTPKTARGSRVVALDTRTLSILCTHRDRCGGGPNDLVFRGPDGSPLTPIEVSRRFKKLAADLGLPVIRLHDLRHTHATLALEVGVHPKIVSERLGHASIAITLDVYSHAIPHMQAEAADQIASLIENTDPT